MQCHGRRGGRRAPALLLGVLTSILVLGCAPKPLTLRADVTPIVPSQRLQGMRVAVVDVQDLRKEAKTMGAHRDGLARVTQHAYEPGNDPRLVTQRLLELMLLADGAQVVPPPYAQVRIAIGIEKLEITTDAPLAGEETFGRVEIVANLTDAAGRPLGTGRFFQDVADEDHADRGLLGDALRDTLAQVVAALQPARAMPGGMPPPAMMPPGAPPAATAPSPQTMPPANSAAPAATMPPRPPAPTPPPPVAPPPPAPSPTPFHFPTD